MTEGEGLGNWDSSNGKIIVMFHRAKIWKELKIRVGQWTTNLDEIKELSQSKHTGRLWDFDQKVDCKFAVLEVVNISDDEKEVDEKGRIEEKVH